MATELSAPLKFFMVICGSFVAFGSNITWFGAWVLQPLFFMPPCARVGNSTPCCPTCLGISHFELGLYIAIPSLIAIGSAVVSGLIIDIYGLHVAALLFGIFSFLGSAVRAMATELVTHHNVMFFLFTLGEVLVQASHYCLVVCRDYIPIRYFKPSFRPAAIGIVSGISNSGTVLSGFVIAPFASEHGVPLAFWIFAGFSAIAVLVSVALCVFSASLR